MKVKVLKAHYHNASHKMAGETYECNNHFGKKYIKLGLVEEVKENKKAPQTKKGATETKGKKK
jgi:hypothetical protein